MTKVSFQSILGAALSAVREDRGWTQAELALQLSSRGLHSWGRPTVAAVEAGNREVSPEEILQLAIALGLPLRDLVAAAWELGERKLSEWVVLGDWLELTETGC